MNLSPEKATVMLREHGMRSTRLAQEVVMTLADMPVPATAKILHSMLRHHRADLATIHRILIKGEQAGLFRTVRFQDRSQWYEMSADSPHYHHLFCTHCQRIERLRYCLADQIKKAAMDEMGFEVLSHKTEMFGICRTCRGTTKPKSEPAIRSGSPKA
jgi:Fur family transcriptional regulator, ferric uptake regulator